MSSAEPSLLTSLVLRRGDLVGTKLYDSRGICLRETREEVQRESKPLFAEWNVCTLRKIPTRGIGERESDLRIKDDTQQ